MAHLTILVVAVLAFTCVVDCQDDYTHQHDGGCQMGSHAKPNREVFGSHQVPEIYRRIFQLLLSKVRAQDYVPAAADEPSQKEEDKEVIPEETSPQNEFQPEDDSAKDCGENEVYSQCKAGCESFCHKGGYSNLHPDCRFKCQPGCVCKVGFVRPPLDQPVRDCISLSACKEMY